MIDVFKYEKGAIKKGSLDDLKKSNVVMWADVHIPSKDELNKVREETEIDEIDFKRAVDEEERPRTADLNNYSLLTFRAPLFENGDISTTSVAIFVSKNKNNVITVRHGDTKSISKIRQLVEAGKTVLFEKGVGYFVYRLLDEILKTYFIVIDNIEDGIEKIEKDVIESPDKKVVSQIFEIKKTLIYFNKSLIANREIIASIEKQYVTDITGKHTRLFRDLYNDIVQLIDTSTTLREVLTGTLDVYLSSASNNLNQVMKTLTVGASLILIPTLIASIYGMNFSSSPYNLPELGWKYGYFFALGVMVVSVAAMYIFFKRKGWV